MKVYWFLKTGLFYIYKIIYTKNVNCEIKNKKNGLFQKNKKIEELNNKIKEKESIQKIIKLQYDSFETKSDEKLRLLNSITESIEKENFIYRRGTWNWGSWKELTCYFKSFRLFKIWSRFIFI